jgi:UDP-3-O-[3-hydroxymyristoyl] glucosamine N-acyltransferase
MPVASSASIGSGVFISDSAHIWDLAQLRDGVNIGDRVIVGRGAYLGTNVTVGDDCKIQNYALIYEPTTLERGVFVGPSVIFTNDRFPRAVTPEFKQKKSL